MKQFYFLLILQFFLINTIVANPNDSIENKTIILKQDSILNEKFNKIIKEAQSTYDKTMSLSEKNIEFANTLIDWTALILSFTGIIIVIGTYFGVREYRQIKKAINEIKKIKTESKIQYDEIKKIKEDSVNDLKEIKKEFILKTETFMISSFNYNIAEQAYKIGDFENALKNFQNAYKYSPNDTHILCRIGRTLCNLDRNYQANEYFKKALLINDNSYEAFSGLATSMRYINLDNAINYCQKALDIKPDHAFLHDYLGLLHRDKNEINKCLDCHIESIRLKPDNSVSYFYLSIIHTKLGQIEKGKSSMQTSVIKMENDKKLRPVWKLTIEICNKIIENNIDQALNDSLKIKELFKKNKRVEKVSIGHIQFLLIALKQDNQIYKFNQIFENE